MFSISSSKKYLIAILTVTLVAFTGVSVALACDALVVMPNCTKDGSVIFAKEMDRGNNECPHIVSFPREHHKKGEMVKCTHIEIPQVEETYAVIGNQPFWMWGFECGMNEFGVSIADMAIWTKDKTKLEEKSLIGADLERLAIERGKTAYEAMHVLVDLLNEYGQWGNCTNVPGDVVVFNNSFLIADPNEAWMLETSNRRWVAKKVTDFMELSNAPMIGARYDEGSSDLVEYAKEKGWFDGKVPFNFARVYTDFGKWPDFADVRQNRAMQLLQARRGEITPEYVERILRDHYEEDSFINMRFGPMSSVFRTLDYYPFYGHSVTSMMTHLRRDESIPEEMRYVYYSTLSSPGCSIFMPFYLNAKVPEKLAIGTDKYSVDSPWWTFEKLMRMTEYNQAVFMPMLAATWKDVELLQGDMKWNAEREAKALFEQGKKDEAMKVLSDLMAQNLDRNLTVATKLQESFKILYPVLPARIPDVKTPRKADTYDKQAGIDVWGD